MEAAYPSGNVAVTCHPRDPGYFPGNRGIEDLASAEAR